MTQIRSINDNKLASRKLMSLMINFWFVICGYSRQLLEIKI